jgi:hypothetical protein
MPYGTIALIVSFGVVLYFMFVSAASPRAKAFVGSVFGASLVFTQLYVEWWLVGLLLQCVLVVGLMIYFKASRPGG